MNNLSLAVAGGAIGMLVTLWQQAASFANRLISFAIVKVNLEDDLCQAVALYCWAHLKRNPLGTRRYESHSSFVKPKSRTIAIGYESFGKDAVLFWDGWKPLMVGAKGGRDENAITHYRLTVTFLRGTFDLDELLIRCLDLYNEQMESAVQDRFQVRRVIGKRQQDSRRPDESIERDRRFANDWTPVFQFYRLLKWNHADIGQPKSRDPLRALAFPQEVRDLIREFKRWKESEAWFKGKQIPWRRGWLLYGKPGTGKTSLVRACAQVINVPIFSYDLASLNNEEMFCAWREMLSSVPCIALLEDIDTVFHLRTNILGERSGGLSFDCLLNCISGIEQSDGVFTVVTTNDVSKIDPALGCPKNGMSTRPGRLDRAIELKELDEPSRRTMAERILSDCPQEVEVVIAAGLGDTGAQFQERCAQVALRRYW